MKKLSSIIFIVSLFLFAACDGYNDDNFKGLDNLVKPTNPGPFDLVYTGAPFSATNPAKDKIPAWLSTQILTADTGAIATVSYKYLERGPIFTQDFENATISASGWQNIAVQGTTYWTDVTNSGANYVQFTANKTPGVCEGWLISPKYKLVKGSEFSFDVCVGYYNAECLKVLVSSNYNGNISAATWKDITSSFDIPKEPTNAYGNMESAGTLNLDQFLGKNDAPAFLTFAFCYVGDGANKKTTTYQIDNILLSAPDKKEIENSDEYVFKGYTDKWAFVRTVPKFLLNEDFNNAGENTKPTEILNWLNVAVQGTYTWTTKSYSGNFYTQFSANKAPGVCEGWLITPPVMIKENVAFSFDVCVGYYNAECLQVMISTDFDGDPDHIGDAEWKDVTDAFSLPKEPTNTYGVFGPAGTLSMAGYVGQTIYIGFKYLGDGVSSKTTTYQIDNVLIGEK